MSENYAYLSPDYEDIFICVRKEAIIYFLLKLDELLKQYPKTEEEFQEKYSHIREMSDDECNEYVEYNVMLDILTPLIKVTDDKLYYITNDECDEIIKKLTRIIYLKLCSQLVDKGVLEAKFDSKINDFVFAVKENHKRIFGNFN